LKPYFLFLFSLFLIFLSILYFLGLYTAAPQGNNKNAFYISFTTFVFRHPILILMRILTLFFCNADEHVQTPRGSSTEMNQLSPETAMVAAIVDGKGGPRNFFVNLCLPSGKSKQYTIYNCENDFQEIRSKVISKFPNGLAHCDPDDLIIKCDVNGACPGDYGNTETNRFLITSPPPESGRFC
jgi:hypothetical protein